MNTYEIDPTVRLHALDLSCTFRRSLDQFGAFGNMTGGYPLYCNGIYWKSSEALYQATRYPDFPEIQEAIRQASNGFTAKLVAKAKYHHTRPDWDDIKVEVMIAAVYAKIASNPKLWKLLAKTYLLPIVEISHKDEFWGAVPLKTNPLVARGSNILGQVWMKIRHDSLVNRAIPVPRAGLLPGKKDIFSEFTE